VGFRPFVFRLAGSLNLRGWVSNTPQGVVIEVEGPSPALQEFLNRIESNKPPRASIHGMEYSLLDPAGLGNFAILESGQGGEKSAVVLPDIATCPDCLAEILAPGNRRHRYPFTNCTNCGPRYSIIESLPYDRVGTTMRGFAMCPACLAEYEDPADRRFHAQPNACPECGPRLEWWDRSGAVLAEKDGALAACAAALREGKTVAVKGLGGFHLMVDARNTGAVASLRRAKDREEKPLALLFPSLDAIAGACQVAPAESRVLRSPEAPIVYLRKLPGAEAVAPNIAPGNPFLGIMLPSNPLHHLLMADLGFPLVATSGNISDETICTDEREALSRIGGMSDYLLVHNRPIARHVDDSIVRIMLGRELVLRRARGFAPMPLRLPGAVRRVLAAGAHLKNTVTIAGDGRAIMSQHIGDLETSQSREAQQQTAQSLMRLHSFTPEVAACDAHPDYHSTRWAESLGLPVVRVQHHLAHALSCMADNDLAPPVLAVVWDGTGYGTDGTVWGGEFLIVRDHGEWERAAHFRTFRLPGGEAAVREPRRSALGVLWEIFGPEALQMRDLPPVAAFTEGELRVIGAMLEKGLNSPVTSSVGRLFDAAAALAGLHQVSRYEGQSAMALEADADGSREPGQYPLTMNMSGETPFIDWEPVFREFISDIRGGKELGSVASKWHNTLVESTVKVASYFRIDRVLLTGGCFQNRVLTEKAVTRLAAAGFRPYFHQRIPPNDGGISLGQAVAASRAE
jgi:hydrogenase maturation protein HypF